jgi:hypothetical protein
MSDSVLLKEQFAISGASPDIERKAYYDAIIHTKEHDFKLDMLVSVVTKSDFINDQVTYIEIDAQFPLGDFIRFVYPERETLSITLINFVVGAKTTTEYHLLIKDVEEDIKSNILSTVPLDELNKSYTNFRAQCISKSFKNMRTKTIEGVYKDATVTDVMSTILLKEFGLFGGVMGYGDNGLSISPSDNPRVYKHVIIPNDKAVIDVPAYLQTHKAYGVYNAGISLFFMSGQCEKMFIFPTHKTDAKISKTRMDIYGYSSTVTSTLESTYTKDGDTIKVIVTKSNKLNDDDIKNRDKGTRISSIEANSVTSRPYQVSDGKLVLKEEWLKNRQNHKEMESGSAPVKTSGVTGNQYDLRSTVTKDDGIVLTLQWNYSNVSLLEPMMSVTYTQELGDKVVEYSGILQRVDSITDNNKRVENALLFIFVKPSTGFKSGNGVFDSLSNVAESLAKF